MLLCDKYYDWAQSVKIHVIKLSQTHSTQYAAVYLAKSKHNKN